MYEEKNRKKESENAKNNRLYKHKTTISINKLIITVNQHLIITFPSFITTTIIT